MEEEVVGLGEEAGKVGGENWHKRLGELGLGEGERNESEGELGQSNKEVGDVIWMSENQHTPFCLPEPPQTATTGRGRQEVEERERRRDGVQRGRGVHEMGVANVNQL